MLKQNVPCGGDSVPVTFAEFDVAGARPVDIFNTMLDTPLQKKWNTQCSSVTPLGEWLDQGARGWAVIFKIPFVSEREFLQWQVADADFAKEEFWLAFSTQNNDDLQEKSPIRDGAVMAQNCLGAYHITKGPNGAHVVVTQQVNVHPFIAFPLHQVLDIFPTAWQGTIDFVNQMSHHARQLALAGASANETVAPAFMLNAEATVLPSVNTFPVFMRAAGFPKLNPATKEQSRLSPLSPLQCAAFALLIPTALLLVCAIGYGAGRCAAGRFEVFKRRGSAWNEALME